MQKRLLITLFALLFHSMLNAQVDLRNISFTGKVHENGQGIAGVAVTDGVNIVLTDHKGHYNLKSNATVHFVYISVPTGYDIPLENKEVKFYVPIKDKAKNKQQIDFKLTKAALDQNKHAFIAWADPQVYFEDELGLLRNAAKDVQELVKEEFATLPVHGFVCGDVVGDKPSFFQPVRDIATSTGVPFFYTMGNHDLKLDVRSNELSKENFEQTFGPTYYSFNRGKVHYVVLDDVFYVARSYQYIGYLPEQQLNWLQQDLAQVPPGSTVVVAFHIPSYTRDARHGRYNKELMNNSMQNRQALYSMLKPYNAHILSGHMHYNENFTITDQLFEHVHAALCGLFWQAPMNCDGTPLGYRVYEVNGNDLKWYYKSIGKNKNHQFRAYKVGDNPRKPTAITANVWNHDSAWKVYWYENGIKQGEMEQFTDYDPAIFDYVSKNSANFKHKWISADVTEHLFFAEPSSSTAKIKVEVIDRFGNVYTEEL